ncbi:MAG: M56 family metallopeptidase [Clostridium sp.]|nr:M56 family metallopeptidase [Acetatifactor muris]MCM1526735.1 M56 family metallopeptidase [Bacteroides sp.]MCM1562805.1 M56 family metallopeptidase [Clostridium sp.]
MLQSSISTVLMAVITTNLFIILLTLLFRNAELMIRTGYRQLALLVVFSALRFVLPIEFPFTVTVRLPRLLSKIILLLHSELFTVGGQFVSLWRIFLLVWAVGFLMGLSLHLLSYIRARHYIILYGKVLSHKEPYRHLLEQICAEWGRPNRFTVLEMPGLRGPVLFGLFSPKILVPEGMTASERELYYVLRHEAAHHFHRDLWFKNLIRLITLVYWWDPFCALLYRQADVILEMRTDDSLTLADRDRTMEYMGCLISLSEQSIQQAPLPRALTMSLFPAGRSKLKDRFLILTKNQERRSPLLNATIFLCALSVYLLSYAFIPEAYDETTIERITAGEEGAVLFFSEENAYAIDNGDGTYDLYFYDVLIGQVDSLKYYPEDIPVYTRDEIPQDLLP